jgi:Ca-activated chloride channel family protein
MFRFAYPQAFVLLALLVPLIYLSLRRKRGERSVAFSSFELLEGARLEASAFKRYGRLVLRMLVLALIVFAIARPQTGRSENTIKTEGIDIILLLDTSSSMQAEDLKPKNRLHVAKQVVKEFISKLKNDRIGLVVFSAQSITQCPLTLDYDVLTELVDGVDFGMIEDGTAIGTALATACNRLKDSEAKSRVVVLLTDGRNNMGAVAPSTAAEVAKTLDIKVYTVGVGKKGMAPIRVKDPLFGTRMASMKVELDEETLIEIAELTEGQYFRATDAEELKQIYDRIDELEKTEIETQTFTSYTDKFPLLILPALLLLVMELGLAESLFREIP